jgi:hypothetical protein
VGDALRDLADKLSGAGTGEQFVREVEGGFEAPNSVVEYYARVTVTPTGQEPIEPDNGEHPDNTLPEPEVPEEPDPNAPYPDNTLPGPGSAGGEHPDNTLPEPEPQPEPPVDEFPPYPDNSLPEEQPYPDNSLPGEQPYPDNSLPEPEEPDVEEPEPGNPLEPPIGRPDESWTVAELKAWAAEHDIELATGLRKDDILVVINQSDAE